jgi:hypothetical protein
VDFTARVEVVKSTAVGRIAVFVWMCAFDELRSGPKQLLGSEHKESGCLL